MSSRFSLPGTRVCTRITKHFRSSRALEQLPVTLLQRRIYVLPSGAGFGMGATLLVMLITSINYRLSLGYALTFLLGGVTVASLVAAFRNLLGLRITGGRAEPVFAGGQATFELLLENERTVPRSGLTLISVDSRAATDLPAAAGRRLNLTVNAPQRGWLSPGRITIETRYPLGYARAWAVLHPDLKVLVYPRLEENPPPMPRTGARWAGNRASQNAGDDDFSGLRIHQPADSPRHVAWKVVARGGPMLIKQFSADLGRERELDWSQLPPDLGLEARISRLAAWAVLAEREGQTYTLRLPEGVLGPDSGPAHLHSCLARLALLEGNPRGT